MWLLAVVGMGMVSFGLIMIIKPTSFADGIIRFSEWPWFHPFEITSRLAFGVLFFSFASTTSYPILMKVIGAILCFVAVFLSIIGKERHMAFARQSARIGVYFRPIGVLAITIGICLIYLMVNE